MFKPAAAAVSPEGVVLVLEDSTQNNRIQALCRRQPDSLLHQADDAVLPAIACNGGRDLPRLSGGVLRLSVCARARDRRSLPPGYLSSDPDRYTTNLNDSQHQRGQTVCGLLAQCVHLELSGAKAAQRPVSGLDRAIRQFLDADLSDSLS